jgi:hypothetical protein
MSSSVTSRALCIRELLALIFDNLPGNDIQSCLLVNKKWSDVALDALWRKVYDAYDIFKNLAPLQVSQEGDGSWVRAHFV